MPGGTRAMTEACVERRLTPFGACPTSGAQHKPVASMHNLKTRLESGNALVGIVGLGYVGLPLALTAIRGGLRVLGFDIDVKRVSELNAGVSSIRHIPSADIKAAVDSGAFEATADPSRLGEPDAILIAVPTPLSKQREPDLSYVVNTTRDIARTLRPGQLVVLESTTYPGTTRDVMRPILEAGGLKSGADFFLAFSPEREDPGNATHSTRSIPKVVGGDGAEALELASLLYGRIVEKVVPVSSPETAEAVKLTENIFRAVNIALVNELKGIYAAMGVDIWEVIEAAKTKPFGYMPFYPGPGLGGHCIPIDPFYLTWKAREYDIATRFVELAGHINTQMPYVVVEKTAAALDRMLGKPLSRAKVLIVGVAYKKNVDDMRESPSLKLMEILAGRGAAISYHDPYVPEIPRTREHPEFAGMTSSPLSEAVLAAHDVVLISTDHDGLDYALVAEASALVIDTRNAMERHGVRNAKVVKA
jgi:UDP-N-acetyl-D-glucosamine dehydrogenase